MYKHPNLFKLLGDASFKILEGLVLLKMGSDQISTNLVFQKRNIDQHEINSLNFDPAYKAV